MIIVILAVFGAIASGGLVQSSFYRISFGLGTIPLMTTVVFAGNFLSSKMKAYVQKAIPVLVVLIGLLFILRGMGLGIPYVSPKPVDQLEVASSQMECHP